MPTKIQESIQGIDSKDLEVRLASEVYLINNFPSAANYYTVKDELLGKFYGDLLLHEDPVAIIAGVRDIEAKAESLKELAIKHDNSKTTERAVDTLADIRDVKIRYNFLKYVTKSSSSAAEKAIEYLSDVDAAIVGIKDAKSKVYALKCIAECGKDDVLVKAVDAIVVADDIENVAHSLAYVAQYGKKPASKRAISHLSTMHEALAGIEDEHARAESLQDVARYGEEAAALKAIDAIAGIKNAEKKANTLREIVMYCKKRNSVAEKAVDAIAGMEEVWDKVDALESVAEGDQKHAAKKAKDYLSDMVDAIAEMEDSKLDTYTIVELKVYSLVTVIKHGKKPAAEKARTYLSGLLGAIMNLDSTTKNEFLGYVAKHGNEAAAKRAKAHLHEKVPLSEELAKVFNLEL